MKYFARGMRDLLRKIQLNSEFYEDLDDFQINFVEMCFKQSYDEKMGLMGDIESYNYHLFKEFQNKRFEEMYGLDEYFWKKTA